MSLRLKLALLVAVLIAAAVVGTALVQLDVDRSAATRALGATQMALAGARADEIDKALGVRINALQTGARAFFEHLPQVAVQAPQPAAPAPQAAVPAYQAATPASQAAAQAPQSSVSASQPAAQPAAQPLQAAARAAQPAAQTELERQAVLRQLFSRMFLVSAEGRVLAAAPFSPERIGTSIADRAYFARARDERRTVVSEPLIGRPSGVPQIVIAAPVYDAAGRFRGQLLGVLDILSDDVVGALAREKIGRGGYFILASRSGPLLLSHPDKTQVMVRGRKFNPTTERALAGWEGWAVGENTAGTTALYAFRQIRNADWVVGAAAPVTEVLQPLAQSRQRVLLAAALAALGGGLLGWALVAWPARRLTGLQRAVEQATASPDYVPPPERHRRDELGALARDFAKLLAQRAALQEQVRQAASSGAAELAARSRELVRQEAEMETFLYTLGHDLRAPLRAVQGFAALVAEQESGALSTDSLRLLERVGASSRHMSSLVDGMLELGRISKVSFDAAFEALEMNALVADVMRRHALPSEVFDPLPALPAARGDARLVSDVWGALLDNAVKFSARTAAPRIRISARVLGGEVEYAVADNGVGFDAVFAESLFRPFSRLDTAGQYDGIGLGLAIARRALDKMGGRARCESTPGQGATFYFTLPAAPRPDA
jgi:signal transduction histidine kinase